MLLLRYIRPSQLSSIRSSIYINRVRTMSDLSLEYTPGRAEELKENIDSVLKEIEQASGSSKIKPASDIKALYDAGHRHFGENYIQEMVDKAEVLPKDIKWHFVGALQSNKAKLAGGLSNLFVLETLSSIKVADILQKSLSSDRISPLNVYLQINTSGEDSKSGVEPKSDALVDLALHVIHDCPGLKLLGLMTIGSWDASHDTSKPNPDFTALKETRKELVRVLKEKGVAGVEEEGLELSMGMSADFAQAVKEGSSSVRVGTRIFGERPKKQ